MNDAILGSLSQVGVRGGTVIGLIVAILVAAVGTALVSRARYGVIAKDLRRNGSAQPTFRHPVLDGAYRDTLQALQIYQGDVNTQAIIDSRFQADLKGLLLAERFIRASVGLLIILGLVGTFLGLTLSIGELVSLVSEDTGTDAALVTRSLTAGLTEALSGMSVAFSTSLFGILAAIVMTVVNVFVSVSDARLSVAAQLETYLDNTVLASVKGNSGAGLGLDQVVTSFGHAVSGLQAAVVRFEESLSTFATNTRDFQEFNYHLKDNVQRMSVAFSDLKGALSDERARHNPPQRGR